MKRGVQDLRTLSGHETRDLRDLDAITRFLFVEDEPVAVDLCLVLGAPNCSNADPAIEMYRDGLARKFLVTGFGPAGSHDRCGHVPEYRMLTDYMVAAGLPCESILQEQQATNTLENFVFSAPLIDRHIGWEHIRKIAIAGKPLHMRRARMTATQHLPEHLEFVMRPSIHPENIQADTWWRTTVGCERVFRELGAISTYCLEGDIGRF